MTTSLQFESGSLAQMAITGAVKACILPLWLAWAALVALAGLWRPIALFGAIAGCVAVCAVCPVLPMAIGLIAAFGWATVPRTAVVS